MSRLTINVLVLTAFFLCGCERVHVDNMSRTVTSTSILDLRYGTVNFSESKIMLHGYFPREPQNPLWIYMSTETASRKSDSYGIQLVVSSDDIPAIHEKCGGGYAFVAGYYTVPGSSGIGLLIAEKIVMHDQETENGLQPCWELPSS